jgi:hypothetical protein
MLQPVLCSHLIFKTMGCSSSLKKFRFKELPLPVFWEKLRITELPVAVILETSKNWQ